MLFQKWHEQHSGSFLLPHIINIFWKRKRLWQTRGECREEVEKWMMPAYWNSRIQQQRMNMFWGSEVLHWTPVLCLITQSCPTLWDPMDGSPPGSSIHGILQARIQEWVAIPSSRGSSQPRSPTLQADSLLSEPSGKTMNTGSGEAIPSPGFNYWDLPDPGIKPGSHALQADSLPVHWTPSRHK